MSATLATLLPVLFFAAAQGENRQWFVDLELRGSCAEVRIDCGPDGETRFLGPFAAGENRRLSVPVPVRSLVGAGLSALPLPQALVLPPDAGATTQVLGWSALQPALEVEQHAGALRSRPPFSSAVPRAAWPELVLVLIAGGFLLRLRRRALFFVPVALAAGLASLALARSRRSPAGAESVLGWEAGGTEALAITVARDELALPRGWLEVTPAGCRLEFVLGGRGPGLARARGAQLTALERAGVPSLSPERNDGDALVACWTRTAAGEWSARGAWARGAPMGSRRRGDPPGWLASALPPGRSALVGRTAAGEWLRCLGFPAD